MSFLNKKEEVIDLILTTKGRKKYAASKLDPQYYEFYDDEIVYDKKYYNSGSNEPQNEIIDRIRRTLISKNQSAWQGPITKNEPFVVSKEPFFYELGESDPFSQNKPAWMVTALKGVIDGSVGFVPLEKNIADLADYQGEKIPQFNAYCQYTVYVDPFTKDIYYDRSSNDFLFLIAESNEIDEVENFEVEVYQYIYDKNGNVKNLQPLYFDGSDYTEEYVEYFVNVLFDTPEGLEISYVDLIKEQEQLVKTIVGECDVP
jgi:hypothetical protein